MNANAVRVHEVDRWSITRHAAERMNERRVPLSGIEAALEFGRRVRIRGVEIYAIGRKEVARYARDGVDLARLEGMQVVCSFDGHILTAYRNKDFRGLRRGLRFRPASAA